VTHAQLVAMNKADAEAEKAPVPKKPPPLPKGCPSPKGSSGLLGQLADDRDLRGARKREPPAPPPAPSRSWIEQLSDGRQIGAKRAKKALDAATAMASTGAAASAAENLGAEPIPLFMVLNRWLRTP
jgi:hypothetical protein